jgi:hypothetical protein
MSLSGALESFPVVEVLKLAGRAGKTGVLRVEAQGLEARIYLTEGRLTYGTTRRDEEFHAKLVEAGMVDPKAWVDVERRERSISDILEQGSTKQQLDDFMLDQISDVVFRVLRETSGRFAFSEDVAPRFETGVLLEVDSCVHEAAQRMGRWKQIEQVIPGIGFHLRLAPDAAKGASVEVADQEWKVLAGLAGSGTVEEVARKHGWSEFKAAELMASMVRRNLLVVSDGRPEGRYTYGESEGGGIEVVGVRVPVEEPPADDAGGEELRSALSEISHPESPSTLQRRRGLGAILREADGDE